MVLCMHDMDSLNGTALDPQTEGLSRFGTCSTLYCILSQPRDRPQNRILEPKQVSHISSTPLKLNQGWSKNSIPPKWNNEIQSTQKWSVPCGHGDFCPSFFHAWPSFYGSVQQWARWSHANVMDILWNGPWKWPLIVQPIDTGPSCSCKGAWSLGDRFDDSNSGHHPIKILALDKAA